jgi:hypothetical protein
MLSDIITESGRLQEVVSDNEIDLGRGQENDQLATIN